MSKRGGLFAFSLLVAFALAGTATGETQSQPIEFARDVQRDVYQVTSLDMPNIEWERVTIALNWTAAAPLDVYIMRCNDTDKFEHQQPFDPLFAGAGATGNMHATLFAHNYTEQDVCIVLDNTHLGSLPSPSGPEGDLLHVEVVGVETVGPLDGAIDAGPGGNSAFVPSLVLALTVILIFGAIIVIGHRRRRPTEVYVEQQVPQQFGPPPGFQR